MQRSSLTIAIAALVTLGAGAPIAQGTTIYAPNAIVDGQSISDWTKGWWNWAAGLPASGNAFDDPTGALAHQNNNGPVFYAAGYFSLPAGYSQPPVLRSFSVPAGQPILVGLVNLSAFQLSEADETSIISSFRGTNLMATVDGAPVANLSQYFQPTDFFSAGPIEPHTIGASMFATPGFPGVPPDCAPTDLCPGLSTGYWLMLNLSPGVHTIDTGGTGTFTLPPDLGGGDFSITVGTDYTITATAPEPASALLIIPGLLGVCAARRLLPKR